MDDLFALDAPFERVSVLLPLPLDAAYDYKADPAWGLGRGAVVEVPLGRRRLIGVVLGPGGDDVPDERLRGVIRAFDVPPLPAAVLDLVDWVASWTLAPRGSVLRMAVSSPGALEPPPATPEIGRASCRERV